MSRLFLASLLFVLGACGCENNILRELASPDGNLKVVMFDRNCGATTRHNLQLAITTSGESAIDSPIFVVDRTSGQSTEAPSDDLESLVQVSWLSSSELLVRYNPELRVFTKQDQVGEVQIRYESNLP